MFAEVDLRPFERMSAMTSFKAFGGYVEAVPCVGDSAAVFYRQFHLVHLKRAGQTKRSLDSRDLEILKRYVPYVPPKLRAVRSE